MSLEKLYTVPEAAKALRRSEWTIWKWIQIGKLRSAKVGVGRVIRESELQRLIIDDPLPAEREAGCR